MPPHPSSNPEVRITPRLGFTLIELLTAIAIIAILAAISIVSAGRVREAANIAKCGATLRGVTQGMFLWANDNRNTFPAERPPGYGVWSNALIVKGYVSAAADSEACPTHLKVLAGGIPEGVYVRSYFYAVPVLKPADEAGVDPNKYVKVGISVNSVTKPSRTYMLVERHTSTATKDGTADRTSANGARVGRDVLNLSVIETNIYHRNGARHFSFFDGHVEFRSMSAARSVVGGDPFKP